MPLDKSQLFTRNIKDEIIPNSPDTEDPAGIREYHVLDQDDVIHTKQEPMPMTSSPITNSNKVKIGKLKPQLLSTTSEKYQNPLNNDSLKIIKGQGNYGAMRKST